jgi:hypothetical protein
MTIRYMIAIATAIMLAVPPGLEASDPPMPRVQVVNGEFSVQGTQGPFRPIGFNYIIVGPHPEDARVKWHHVFHPDKYNRSLAESDLATIAANGFNTVRIFLDHTPGRDGGLGPNGPGAELHKPTMDNIIDFLQIARRNRLYVIVTTCYLPNSPYYRGQAEPGVGELNSYYLNLGAVNRKAEYVAQIAATIKGRDPGLLSTVLAWDLENESTFHVNHQPFSDKPQRFPFLGRDYDLSKNEGVQSLMDASIVHWINTCVDSLRSVDAQALVTDSVFFFGHVGRHSGPGKIWDQVASGGIKDGRVPARPLAIVGSKADFIQVHTYLNPQGQGLEALEQRASELFASIEFEDLKKALISSGKPLFCGEFGLDERWLQDPAQGPTEILRQVNMLAAMGFSGYLLWTYSTPEPDRWLNATADQGKILKAMAANRPTWGSLAKNSLPPPKPWLYDHIRPKDESERLSVRRLDLGSPAAVEVDGVLWYPIESFTSPNERFPVKVGGSRRTSGIDRVRPETAGFLPGTTWMEGVREMKIALSNQHVGEGDVMVENKDEARNKVELTGPWVNNHFISPTPGATATWRTDGLATGEHEYEVHIYVAKDPNKDHAEAAQYQIFHAHGIDTVTIDQVARAGQWCTMGRWRFSGEGKVVLDASSKGGNFVADDVRWRRVDSRPDEVAPVRHRVALYIAMPGGVRPQHDGSGLMIEVNGNKVQKLDLDAALPDRGCLRIDVVVEAKDWIDLRFTGDATIKTPPLAAVLVDRAP